MTGWTHSRGLKHGFYPSSHVSLSLWYNGQIFNSILGLKTSVSFQHVSLSNMQSYNSCTDREKLLPYTLSHQFALDLQYMFCYLSETENIPVLTQRCKCLIKHSVQPSMAEQRLYNTTQQNEMRNCRERTTKCLSSSMPRRAHISFFSDTYPGEFWHKTSLL